MTNIADETGVEIRDFLGNFVANHVDTSSGRPALQISPREIQILGESLVRTIIGWALGSNHAPYSEIGNPKTDFVAEIGQRQAVPGQDHDPVRIRFTLNDTFALGQFFALRVLEWAQGIQIERNHGVLLMEALTTKQSGVAAAGSTLKN